MRTDSTETAHDDKILVVDDDEFVCNSLKWLLMEEGYDVGVAADGKTALRKMKEEDYDLILTDLMMPEVDGLAVLREAKESNPDTAVIILTGYGTLEAAISALEDGAYDFLTKPCDDGEMKYKIRGALEQRRLRRRVARLEEGPGEDWPAAREMLRVFLSRVDAQLERIQSQPPEAAGKTLAALRDRLNGIASLCEMSAGTVDPATIRRRLEELSG